MTEQPKLCSQCGQPMKPKGVKKLPGEYDHAQGCPYANRTANPSLSWEERGLPKPGRKPIDVEALGLAERLGVAYRRIRRCGVARLMACADDAARMVILGGVR